MHNLIQARTTLVASTLNGARRLDASGVLLPHQWHLKPRESSLAALHHVLNFQGRRLALLPPPPVAGPHVASSAQICPADQLCPRPAQQRKKTLVSPTTAFPSMLVPSPPGFSVSGSCGGSPPCRLGPGLVG